MTRAAVFAGQGAQKVGMGKDLATSDAEIGSLFTRANEILGYDLTKILWEGPIEELTRTCHCQPAIFLVSTACYHALRKAAPGCVPAGTAGLSLGEWTALYAAGVIDFADTLRVLEARGRFMQEACDEQPGGMVSIIGLSMENLEKICAATGVQIANLNSPEQTVLSGPQAGITEASAMAQGLGAKRVVVLKVAGAYHSRLMGSASKKLEQILAGVTLQAPGISVIANATGLPHGDSEAIRRAMVQQITAPVQWIKTIQGFRAAGVGEYIECGPGNVLSGLIKRIDNQATTHTIQDVATLKTTAAALG